MAQIRDGTVTVTNGDATVVASAGVDWSEAAAGQIFSILGSDIWYSIASVAVVSGHYEIELSAPYASATGAGKNYAISTSFTPNLGIPYPEQGDVETASLFKRAMLMIDENFAGFLLQADTRRSVSTLQDPAVGDVYGIEQVSAAQAGDAKALRIFTSALGSSYLAFGKYTSTTAFTEYGRFNASGILDLKNNSLKFGATWKGTFSAAGLTADRTLSLPDAAGTLALTSDLAAYQPVDADLTAIAALSSTGIARRTASNTWTVGTTVSIAEGGTGAASKAAAFNALSPMTTLGDLIYGDTTGTGTRIAGNTSATRAFLRSVGNGTVAAQPAWDTVTKTDVGLGSVENTALSTWAGSANVITLGTVGTGIWQGTAVAVGYGGTGLASYTKGDLLVASSAVVLAKLAVGSDGFGLVADSAQASGVKWAAIAAAANPTGTVGLSAVNGSATTFLRSDGAPALSQSIAPTWTGVHTHVQTLAANTSGDGIILDNTTAATSGNQRYSPRLRLSGRGWKTTATAASQQVDWTIENRPVQGAASPSSIFNIASQVNGGGYSDAFQITSGGIVTFGLDGGGAQLLQFYPSGGYAYITGRGVSVLDKIYIDAANLVIVQGDNQVDIKSQSGSVNLKVNTTTIFGVTSTGMTGTGQYLGTFDGSTQYGLIARDSGTNSGATFAAFQKSSGTVIGSVTRVGTTDAVAYNSTSDGRLKENVRDFTDSGRLIDCLRPRLYDWKSGDKDALGFIAQELAAADPIFERIGAVTPGDEGAEIAQAWQRSDPALIPILVAEVKSLRARLALVEAAA